MKLLDIHVTQHRDNECGVACLQMILQSHKYYISYFELKKILAPDLEGISIEKINDFLSSLNVGIEYYIKNEDLKMFDCSFDKKEFPCMALLRNEEGNHYIVIHKIRKNNCVYSDPAKHTYTVSDNLYFLNNLICLLIFDFSKFDIKKENSKVKTIGNCIKNKKGDFIIITIMNIIISLLTFFLSLEMGIFLDQLGVKNQIDFLFISIYLYFIFIVMIICKTLIQYTNSISIININKKIEYEIYSNLNNCIIKQACTVIKESSVGDLSARMNNYIVCIKNLYNQFYVFLSNMMILIFSIMWMIRINLYLTLIVMVSIGINMMIVYKTIYNFTVNQYYTLDKYSDYNNQLIEILSGFETIKTMHSEKFFLNKINIAVNKFVDRSKEAEKYSMYIDSYRIFIFAFSELLVFFTGILFIKAGHITTGQLATFGVMLGLMQNISYEFISFYICYINYSINYNRLNQVFDTKSRECAKEGVYLEKVYKIKFINFSLFYNDSILIKNCNFSFENKFIVVSGNSGAGKSSMVRVLAKLNDNYRGNISINDIDLSEYKQDELTKKIVYLSNNDTLFSDTIINNICLGKRVLKKTVFDVCKDCQILEDILNMPNQFDFRINAENIILSMGQRQRMCLAKSILLEPEVLIMDEALSNIDIETRNKILVALQKYDFMKIIITHDELIIPSAQFVEIINKDVNVSFGNEDDSCSL